MTDRVEILRQQARAEAAEREQRLQGAMAIQPVKFTPSGRGRAAYGETACPRCGVRSGLGCKHSPAGEASVKLTSHDQRSHRT